MTIERTEFEFVDKGGDRIVKRLDQIASKSDRVAKSFAQMNKAMSGGGGIGSILSGFQKQLNIQRLISDAMARTARQRFKDIDKENEKRIRGLRREIQERVKGQQRIERMIVDSQSRTAQKAMRDEERLNSRRIANLRRNIQERAREQQRIQRMISDAQARTAQKAMQDEQRLNRERIANLRQNIQQRANLLASARARNAENMQREAQQSNQQRISSLRENIIGRLTPDSGAAKREAARIKELSAEYRKLGTIGNMSANLLERGHATAARGLALVARAVRSVANGFRRLTRVARGSLNAILLIPRAMRSVTRSLITWRTLFAAFLAQRAISGLAAMSDAYLNLSNRIAATNDEAAASTAVLARTQSEMFNIANRARSPIGALGDLYGRLALGASDAVESNQDLLRITETVAKASAVGGGTQQSIEGALIQLSQIFGAGGQARGIGQELRSIREQAPFLFKIMAEGLGRIGATARGTTTEMEKLAEAGELSSAQVAQALLVMTDNVEGRFQRIIPTIDQALTVLSNSWIRFIGTISARTGAGESLAQTIISIANRLDESAEKMAERISTIVTVFNRAFLIGLEGDDLKKANEQFNRIRDVLLNTASDMLSLLLRGFITIGRSAAQVFANVFAQAFGGAIRNVLSDSLRAMGLTGMADSVETDASRLIRMTERINTLRTELSRINVFGEVGPALSENMRVERRNLNSIGQFNVSDESLRENVARDAYEEIQNLQRRSTALSNQINMETERSIDANVAAAQVAIANMTSQFGELKVNLFEAGQEAANTIDTVTSELQGSTSIIDLLRQKAVGYFDAVINKGKEFRDMFMKQKADFETVNKYIEGLNKTLGSQRDGILGFTDRQAMTDLKAEMESEVARVRAEATTALDGVGPRETARGLKEAEEAIRSQMNLKIMALQVDQQASSITERMSKIEQERSRSIEMINVQRDTGVKTRLESELKLLDTTKTYRNELQGVADKLNALAAHPFYTEEGGNNAQLLEQIKDINAEMEVLNAQIEAMNPRSFWGGFADGARRAWEEVSTLREIGTQAGAIMADSVGNGLFNAFERVIDGTERLSDSFRNMAASMLTDFARLIWQASIFNLLMGLSGMGGGIGSFFGAMAGLTPNAKGNMFSGGSIQTFANGGILGAGGGMITRPTVFPMATGMGLAGEAGTEVIMPAERGADGKMGVRATGAGGGAVLPVMMTDRENFERMMNNGEFDEMLARVVKRPNSMTRQALRS